MKYSEMKTVDKGEVEIKSFEQACGSEQYYGERLKLDGRAPALQAEGPVFL